MNSNTGPAGAAELPSCGVQLGRSGQVWGLGELDAVGEGQALQARPREPQTHLAAGLQVVDELVERAALAAGDQLADRRELALLHRGLDAGAARSLRQAGPPAQRGPQHGALAPPGG